MFRTSGYFRGINCPFFASGLCERPYCHFRHVKVEDGEDKPTPKSQITVTGPSTSTQSSVYLDNLSDGHFPLTSSSLKQSISQEDEQNNTDPAVSINKKESVEENDSSGLEDHVKYNKYTGEPITDSEQPPLKFSVNKYTGELVPEEVGTEEYSVPGIAINKYTGKPQGSNGVSHSTDNGTDSAGQEKKWKELLGTTLPTYKPTPLTELKKRNSNPSVNKYSLSCSEQTSSNQEYDPESNYSTKTFISHTLPVRQVDDRPSSYSSKRSVSYDPLTHEHKQPVKRQRTLSLQCEDSKFSSEDEEDGEELSDHKSSCKLSNHKEDNKYSLKDAKFFEKLLDHHDNTESNDSLDSLDSLNDDQKTVSQSKKLNTAKQKSLKDRTSLELNIENSVRVHKHKNSSNSGSSKTCVDNSETLTSQSKDQFMKSSSSHHTKTDSRSHHSEKDSAGSESKITDIHKPASKHKESQEIKTKSSDKSETKHSSAKSRHSSSGSHKKSPHHENTDTKKIEKHSSKTKADNHSKGDNHTKNSNHVKDSKGDNHSKNSKGDDHAKSKSNKDTTHQKHISSKNGECSKHKDTIRHKHGSSKNSECSKIKSNNSRSDTTVDSAKSSTSKEKHEKHRRNSSETSKEKPEKNRRNSSEVTKKKIVNINVDLFGADSDDSTGAVGNMSDDDLDYSALLDEEFSDEDRYEECLRIFQETRALPEKKHSDKKKLQVSPVKNVESVTGKKRVAHKTDTEVMRKAPEVVKTKPSPAQVMHNRFLELQKRAREAAIIAAAEQRASASSAFGEKKRTAHQVPSSPSVMRSNSSTPRKAASSSSSKPEKAITVSTASRTEKRKAHMPSNVASLARPTIPAEFGSKVPSNIRQRYLNMIIDECLKLCSTEQEAYDRGLEEESAVYKRSSSKTVYLNVAVNTIKRLRTELSEMSPSTSKKVKHNNVLSLSHAAVLGGKNATKTTFTVNRSGGGNKLPQENYKGAELYKRLSTYILNEQQLRDNGFPRESPYIPGDAVFFTESKRKINSSKLTNYEKLCIRCGKTFRVFPNGTYANKEECTHHWGKAWKKRIAGAIDTRYTCCQGDLSSGGCQVAKAHVHETNKWDNLSGYMKTFPCSPPIDGDYGVFAMDCEMVYTKAGVELARVTVTDPDNECVYESLVKPDKPVLDYNTRFSGLTEEDLSDVTTTLRDVQAVLLSLFSDKTIVMGHSLESDFSAVKLIHNTVVDTSVVFPHKMGPPYKRALKTLMAEYLKKIIQDDVGGHDSKEDATSCMDLMHLKIKEDARKEPRRK